MRNTKKNQTQRKRKNNKKSIKRTYHRKKGGCGCANKGGTMKGGYGAASFQPFEQTAGQYVVPQNNYNNAPDMPGSGRLSTSVMHGGKPKRSIRNKKMRGGNFLLGNTQSNLPLSFNTSAGGIAGVNTLTGTPNQNINYYSQPIGNKVSTLV